MPLDAKQRASLPDSAFAYIDSQGRRRLPINDAPHVRNALARFNQVVFEDEAARDKARTRLLRAASKYGVVPIGFVSAQLQPQRKLPKGHVTFLLTDVERSTELLSRLEDRYPPLLSAVRRAMRDAVRKSGGREVDARADDLFAVFEQPPAALEAALAIQRAMHAGPWTDGVDVRVRIGVHSGRPTLTETGYVGLSVHKAARICYAAHGGQIVLSSAVQSAVLDSLADGRQIEEPRLVAVPGAARHRGDLPGRDEGSARQVPAAALGGTGYRSTVSTRSAVGWSIRRREVTRPDLGGRLVARCRANYDQPMKLARARAIIDLVVSEAPSPVSVFVADAHGELVAAATMDGAAPDTRLNAQRKAYTAARSDARSTRELAEKVRDDPVERASFDPFFTFFLGGVAVFDGETRLGAVGVSGLPGEVDEQLALRAIEASG